MAQNSESLRDRIERDYLSAMKAREGGRLPALRMLKAAIQSADKSKGAALDEDELVGVITREVKVRRESLTEFERGNRPDLAASEQQALDVLGEYQPPQLSDGEIRDMLRAAVEELTAEQRANSRQATGLLMRAVMPKVKGRADGARVSEAASELLSTPEHP